ncbi:MAG TPA: hypothetical protein VJ577_11430 [Burkholderiaceae bacterium]|nr:hypothetical protein [Burkholderiaceae bacterium]
MIKNIKNFAAYLLLSVLLVVAPQVGAGGVTAPANSGDIKTVGSQTGASDIVLTASAAQYQSIAMTAMGKSVWLEDARQVINGVGGPRRIIRNIGGYPFGIRDSGGTLLTVVAPGGIAYLTLESKGTAAGAWGVAGTGLEPGLVTIDQTLNSTYTSTVLAPFVALDDDTSIHFAAMSSGFAAFVVDGKGKVVSNPVPVSSTASSAPKMAFKVSSASAIVFFGSSTTDHQAAILTLTGATPSLSLSVGAPKSLTATMGTPWDGENALNAPKIAQLSSTLYVASYYTSTGVTTGIHAVAIAVSGADVSIGSPVRIDANASAASTTTYALTATTALVLYKGTSPAPYQNNAALITVSGTTSAAGTPVALGCVSTHAAAPFSTIVSSTKVIVSDDHNQNGALIDACAITVSGASLTAGAAATIEGGATAIPTSYIANSATRYNPHLWALASGATNTIGLWYVDNSGVSRAVVLSETAGTIASGTILYNSISPASSSPGIPLPQGTADFLVHGSATIAANQYTHRLIAHSISGTVVAPGAVLPLEEEAINLSPISSGYARLISGDYCVLAGSSLMVYRSNGLTLHKRGRIALPIANSGGVKPIIGARRMVIPSPSVGTTVGASTNQLRIVSVEFAQ